MCQFAVAAFGLKQNSLDQRMVQICPTPFGSLLLASKFRRCSCSLDLSGFRDALEDLRLSVSPESSYIIRGRNRTPAHETHFA